MRVFVEVVALTVRCIPVQFVVDTRTLVVECRCKEEVVMCLSSQVTKSRSAIDTNGGGQTNPSMRRKVEGGKTLGRAEKEQGKTSTEPCFCWVLC